jgi:DNA-directed RNA polymerase subunit K
MIKDMGNLEKEFTKYEIARILGARALQIAMDAPLLVKVSKEELEGIKYDPIKIAEIEFREGVLPITVKRPLPKKTEKAKKGESEESEATEEAEESEAVKPEKVADKEVDEKEVKEEKEIEEDSEIMELAMPEDEVEDSSEESSDIGDETEQ